MVSCRLPKSVSEPARERESFKYGAVLLEGFATDTPIDGASPRSNTPSDRGDAPNYTSEQSSSLKDTVLASLAQLGLWRTNTDRALISLFDRNHQYIVAETTRQSSLSPGPIRPNQGDQELWLCPGTFPRKLAVCDRALMAQATDPLATKTELPLTLIPDLPSDPRLSRTQHVLSGCPARFYAGVPIRSPTGVDIGVYCVVDPHPRSAEDWSADDTQVLRSISHSIMEYLQSKSVSDAYRRSVRMTRGIGSFVEQESTMSGWRCGASSTAFRDESSREGALNSEQQALQQFRDLSLQKTVPVHLPMQPSTIGSTNATSEESGGPSLTTTTSPSVSSPETDDNIREKALSKIFSRAANLIREGIEIEGVLFLDANFETSAADLILQDNDWQPSPASSPSGDEAFSGVSGQPENPCCGILGFSTSTSSSINLDPGSKLHAGMPMKLLAALLRRYPTGKIFNFDDDGTLLSGGSSEDDMMPSAGGIAAAGDSSSKRPWSRASEGASITRILPGARSVAFVPVWDPKRDRWLAGGFVYTQTPTRTFTVEGELSYLRAFGMLAMSEAQRCEALLVNKAQADVLGSLSHELRTPLHGIMLAAELLVDTQLDVFQGNLLRTLETCGRTLSETIDHLLYFSKVNQLAVARKRERRARKRSVMSDPAAAIAASVTMSEVRLDALVEEVMDSVFAGHVFRHNSADGLWQSNRSRRFVADGAQSSDRHPNPGINDAPLGHDDQVAIFLDIDPYVPYRFRVAAGALRRIVMNLFGNSLKYTQHGTISVALSQKSISRDAPNSDTRVVRIVVADTGQGIAQNFLHNDLFKPFSQENHLSNGTGLGLSLVKKIVASMGGNISIESQVDVGTTATVTLPLSRSQEADGDEKGEEEDEVDKEAKRLKGLRVQLVGFPSEETKAGSGQGIPMSAMQVMCHRWLQMEVICGSKSQELAPDLVLCNEIAVEDPILKSDELIRSPVVVVCANAISAHRRSTENKTSSDQRVYEFVSQPIGPHKLARILHIAFRRWGDLQALSPAPTRHESDPMNNISKRRSTDTTVSVGDVRENKTTPPGLGLEPMRRSELPSQTHPMASSPQPISSPERRQKAASPAAGPKSFLLVDDNPINLSVLCAYMKKLGCKYTTAVDGLEAVEQFQENPDLFGCILMDISMPRLDGIEATKRIRAFEQERQQDPASIFALTGLASASTQEEAYQGGVDVFLSKPVKLKELSTILRERNLI
ncbi:hypothetical protein NM208_g8154 [Fusarium decemcellulare]|uniref:Uncharacterized protein n=1 Tax=Fusarium decemcellulare TaxID=57161 RepID=A0ACC1S6N7_9HYPO|nr:hypothetical protein NM208_g8154 [Fusarium decemcellulare]